MNARLRNFSLWVIVILLLLALFTLFKQPGPLPTPTDISFSQLLREADQGRVRAIVIDGPEIQGTYTDGRQFRTYAPNDAPLLQKLYEKNVNITARPQRNELPLPWIGALLISWLTIAGMGAWIFLARKRGGASGQPPLKAAAMPLSENVRRVVTVVDESGKAVVLFDSDNPHKSVRASRGSVSRMLWTTDRSPAAISGTADRAAAHVGIAPPAGGSVFRIVEFPPITPEIERLDPGHMHGELGPHAPKRGLPPRHPLMHRTRTVDYAIVMEGEIDMLLDDSEIHLKAGDVLIQQGTNHAWVNRGTQPCRIAFVLIDAMEP